MTVKSKVWNICRIVQGEICAMQWSTIGSLAYLLCWAGKQIVDYTCFCIVAVQASRIYVVLVYCCCCCKQGLSVMLSFPPWLELLGWGLWEWDVPCDHSGRNDVFSISCQECVVVSVLRGSPWVREAADTTVYEQEAKVFSMGITTIGWW